MICQDPSSQDSLTATESDTIITETSSLSVASDATSTVAATELTSTPSSTLPVAETTPLSTGAATATYPSGTAVSAASNATETGTNTTSAFNSTVTTLANPNLNETNDPHACHRTSDTGAEGVKNPFCEPVEGESLNISDYKGQNLVESQNRIWYQMRLTVLIVTWDASILAINSNVTVRLSTAASENSSTAQPAGDNSSLFEQSVASAQGFLFINFTRELLKNQNSTNLTLYLQEDDKGNNKQYAGPTFTLNDDETPDNTKPALGPSTTSSSSGSSSKNLGEKVGAPVGTIAFVAILAILAFFLWRRYRRRNGASGGGQDYLSGRSHDQRTAMPATAAMSGGRGHRRVESFHDEPTRGMELQERHSGVSALSQRPGAGDDNWDWGQDTVSSPSSPTSGGRSNVFREELQRQKSSGRGR